MTKERNGERKNRHANANRVAKPIHVGVEKPNKAARRGAGVDLSARTNLFGNRASVWKRVTTVACAKRQTANVKMVVRVIESAQTTQKPNSRAKTDRFLN